MTGVANPRLQPRPRFRRREQPEFEFSLHPVQADAASPHGVLREPPVRGKHAESQEASPRACGKELALGGMQSQTETGEKRTKSRRPFAKRSAIIRTKQKVIDVTHVCPTLQRLLHEVIERIKVHVREELARLVADRQAAATLAYREQVVAGKIAIDRLLRVRQA